MLVLDKHIYIKGKAFSKDQCKNIIDFFEKQKSKPDEHRGYDRVYTNLLQSRLKFVGNILADNTKKYADKHPFLHILYARWDIVPEFCLQKYLPGRAYSGEHMEHGVNEWDSKRILGWMIYLNDIKNKGGTRWPQQNFTSKPRAGDLYIWPASWTHSHHGIAAPNEIKYIATGWCEMHGT